MLARNKQDPRSKVGAKLRFSDAMKYMPSYVDAAAQQNNVPPAERKQIEKLATEIDERKTSGKVQVVPLTVPNPMAGPPSWPPIPPAYCPRAGVWVQYPNQYFASSQPQVQMLSKTPVIRRAPVQRLWIHNNPGIVDVRGLEDSPATARTVDKSQTAYTPIWLK
jgi:hypothetical protein